MKTSSNHKNGFPEPVRILIYLITVVITGFMNWMVIYAGDPVKRSASGTEAGPAEAMVPGPDAEPELEEWLLSFSAAVLAEPNHSATGLESRLARALEPAEDPDPGLEEWILEWTEEILSGDNDHGTGPEPSRNQI
jgi:hypothetical protein